MPTPPAVRLMGPIHVEFGMGAEPVLSQKVRSLLAILAVNAGRVVPLTTILDELWADEGLRNIKNACHATVSRLRRTLDDTDGVVVRTVSSGYQFALPRDQVDIHRYGDALRDARAMTGAQVERAIEAIDRANQLWRGSALEDVDDCPLLSVERDRLRELHLSSLELRGECLLLVGNNWGVISAVSPLSELHPGRERFHEQLMTALYLEGRQLDALGVYQRVCRAFMDDFGLEPGKGLQRLHQRILRQEVVQPAPPSALATV